MDDDGDVTSTDWSIVLTYVSQTGGGTLPEPPVSPNVPPPYYDVNGDGSASAIDALIVNNYLNNLPVNNKVLVATNVYDGGTGGGDGNLTSETRHVDSSSGNDRVTTFTYDWRNRRIITDGEVDLYVESTYDNLDRVTLTQRRNTTSSGTVIGKEETFYDELGRVFQTKRYAVNASTGSVGNALIDNSWYDAAGNVVKQLAGGGKAFTKTQYDGAGRSTKTFIGFDAAEPATPMP